jgi:hypothetical protein
MLSYHESSFREDAWNNEPVDYVNSDRQVLTQRRSKIVAIFIGSMVF